MAVTRLSGGLTPGDGADPRTFPAIWNATASEIETAQADIVANGTAISGLVSDVAVLDSTVTENGTAISGLQSDVSSAQADIVANGTAITGLQSDVTAAESDIDALEAKNIPSFGTATPVSGDLLVYDGTDWVNQAASGGVTRNLLYNGAMQVAQRGTSETGITATGYYTADRWLTNSNALGTWTQTIEADGPTGSGFSKSLKMECTTADAAPAGTDYLAIEQGLEGQDLQGLKKGTSDAESITLSFWVKSGTTGTYIVFLLDQDNSRSISAAYTVDSAGTWEKKVITLPGDTTGAFGNDNGRSLRVWFVLGSGSDYTAGTLQTSWDALPTSGRFTGQTNLAASTSNYWQVTGVQLEVGTVATGFDYKSFGVELAECQRYLQGVGSASNYTIANGFCAGTTNARVIVPSTVTMRTAPSIDFNGIAISSLRIAENGTQTNATAMAVVSASDARDYGHQVSVTVTSGLTANHACALFLNGGGTLFFDAEL